MILFVLFLVFITISCVDENKSKPNIVWLVTEDQSQYFFPFYGDNSVILPNISGLLKNGIVSFRAVDIISICPPLSINHSEIDFMVEGIESSIKSILKEMLAVIRFILI